MKIGIVCPYSWDMPGGVQVHVRDLAEELQRRGHTISVLAAADDDTPVPPYVVSAGRAVPDSLQRLGGPVDVRPAVGFPGTALAARRAVRRAARPRARVAEPRPAGRVVRPTCPSSPPFTGDSPLAGR